ncbi:hypothetical protein Tco_1458618 [Tanacetum coccineum]
MMTLADKAILSGADNRPPMLEKDMYDSWKSIMELYMMNRQHGRMILESVENGPLIWPSIEENGVTRPKKYSELSATEAIQADCDIKATNIILQGLPPEVYALERECKIYDEFDKFAYNKEETLRDFYLRFSLLLNDMNNYNIKLEQFQVKTKFLNTLPPDWSKFVTDVKLSQQYSINQSSTPLLITHPSNDYHSSVHHNAYSPSPSILKLEYAPTDNQQQQQQAEFSQSDLELRYTQFKGDNFLLLRVQVGPTLQEQVEAILGNKGLLFVTTARGKAIFPNSALNLRRNEMIHDPDIPKGQAIQTVITHNVAYQADDLDAYDSDCDELNTAKVTLMENLSHYGSYALAEVHNHNNVNNMLNQVVQAMPSSEQSNVVNHSETEITNDSNIIPYSQYVIESQQAAVQNSNSFA